jgi:hypothetical protein
VLIILDCYRLISKATIITPVTEAVLMNVTLPVNSLLFFFPILTKVSYSRQNLVKHCIINCTKVRPTGPSGYKQTDKYDESNSHFSQLHERAQKPVPMQPKFYVDSPGIKSDLSLERLVAN